MSAKETLLGLSAVLLIGGSLWVVISGSSNSLSLSEAKAGESLSTMKAPTPEMSLEEAQKRVLALEFNKKNCNNPPKDLQTRATDAAMYVRLMMPGSKEYKAQKKLADLWVQFLNECVKRGLKK